MDGPCFVRDADGQRHAVSPRVSLADVVDGAEGTITISGGDPILRVESGSVSVNSLAGSPFARTQIGPSDPPILLCDGDTVFGSRKVATFERMPADSPRKRSRDDASSDSGEETEVDEEPEPAPAPAPAPAPTAAAPAVVVPMPAAPEVRTKYCIIAFVADDAFRTLDNWTADTCDRRVHEHCYQAMGTRHITLYKKVMLTPIEAAQIHFHAPPALPFDVHLPGYCFQQSAGLYLEVGEGSDRIRALQSSLRGLPQGAQREAQLHVSLYRLRPPHPFTREVAKQNFGRVRSGPWARPNIRGARVVRVGIKPEGAPYFPPDCRMLT